MATPDTIAQCRTPQEVAELVRTYSDELVRYAFCVVGEPNAAEEMVLDAMAAFVVRASGRALPKAYLWRMVRNRCMDYLRRHRRQVALEAVEGVLSAGQDVEQEVLQAERRRILYRCMLMLPTDYGHVLYLRYLQDFSVEETARIMAKSTKQVYNLLSRAKVALKELLIKEGIDNEDL